MKLSELGEFGLIQRIQKLSSRRAPGVVVGIGDDAAALKVSSSALLLATTDMLIEGVHFDLSFADYFSLGWKSAAANLSDIAAMGGLPRFCLTSLALPPRISVEHISEFYSGFSALLAINKTVLAGGDTCSSRRDLVISVTVLGEVKKKRMVTRVGAKAGDKVYVTNTLGDAAAGLELLKAGGREQGAGGRKLIEKHLRPIPRVEWGREIALSECASAMIDVSDGLSSDLSHICEQSNVGAVVYSGKVPFSKALLRSAGSLKKTPLHYALSGGEDYELLFTTPPAKIKRLQSLNIPVTEIGEITRTRGLIIVDEKNRKKRLKPTGYNHFSRSTS
jgi:thiamine-monophosphate kinase